MNWLLSGSIDVIFVMLLLLTLLSYGDSHCGGDDLDWAIVKVRWQSC